MAVFCFILMGQGGLLGQTCPADLEWPAAVAAAPGTTGSTVAWPAALQTQAVITDRHASAAAALTEARLPALALGATVCDPVFGTSITRITPNGYSVQLKDAFSPQGSWILAIRDTGELVAVGLDAATGKPRLNGAGQPVEVRLTYEMLPSAPSGGTCGVSNVLFSRKDENIVYLMGCGARVFKYNLAAYSAANPLAGLVAGSNPRSVASWPACTTSYCRKGPVFMDFTDAFGALANDGQTGSLFLNLSDNDETFSGFMTVFNGYKNAQAVFVYRPWNNAFWKAAGLNSSQPLMVESAWQGAAVNKRLIGSQLDSSGRYLTLQVCSDAATNLGWCSTSRAYPLDLNGISQTQRLLAAPASGMVDLTHPGYGNAMAVGQSGTTQALHVNYFSPSFVRRELELPNMVEGNKWWGTYTNIGSLQGPGGDPLAGVLTTFSFEAQNGGASPLSACPARNCRYANEILLFNMSGTHFLRLASTRTLSQDYATTSYWDLPRPVISPDGKYIIFSSNWGTQSSGAQANYAVYLLRTPPAWKMLLDDQITIAPSTKAASPNEYLDINLTHTHASQGAIVLAQDRSQPQAALAGSCMFQVGQNSVIQLADDNGSLQSGPSGLLGQPGAATIANSSCRIDIANSGAAAVPAQGNISYRVRVLFRDRFAGKAIRLVGRATSVASWLDGATIAVDTGKVLKWNNVPGMPPLTVSGDKVYNAGGYYQWGQVAGQLAQGSSFEFKIGAGQEYGVSLSTALPGSQYQNRMQTTVYLNKNWLNQIELQFSQDYGAKQVATFAPVSPGATVRMSYNASQVVVTVDGRHIGSANIVTNGQGLYILANMIVPQAEFLSPKVTTP